MRDKYLNWVLSELRKKTKCDKNKYYPSFGTDKHFQFGLRYSVKMSYLKIYLTNFYALSDEDFIIVSDKYHSWVRQQEMMKNFSEWLMEGRISITEA
jgi:hypothetical protein